MGGRRGAVLRSFEQVNEKIAAGNVVCVTAEELIEIVQEQGVKEATKQIDVVTTGTFGPMCSSGAFLNFGHSDPPIRMGRITLNGVQAYGGLAAVDTYLGATQPSDDVGIAYGGAHVIEDLIAGKKVQLRAYSHGTDCYPAKEVEAEITIDALNQAYLFNPRNAYQNYSAATNGRDEVIHTYMGTLLPRLSNVTYSTSGQLSPLLKDPECRAIGVGTRIFFGGAEGYVAWQGSQFATNSEQLPNGDMHYSGGTLALIGDMKQMDARYIRGASFDGYGVSMFVGVGIPIPVLDEDLCAQLAVPDAHLYTKIYDYGVPSRNRPDFGYYSYGQLRSGSVELNGRQVPTSSLSSLKMAREITAKLKDSIVKGEMLLQQPIAPLPKDQKQMPLNARRVK
ncbi:homocysteine biosynthesis protein [Eubacteriales bacterium OttesenSCG-928-N14]|nr:homocysteine biosynthesis protein [Eubacteriales bacterium OttesenSCG-928-N14]